MNRTKGKYFWKQEWYSFCSAHSDYDSDCKLCQSGIWCYVWLVAINHFFHDKFYGLWYFWVNKSLIIKHAISKIQIKKRT